MTTLPVHAIVDRLHHAGLHLALTPARGLAITPATNLNDDLRQLIRASKSALVDWLQSPVGIHADAANDATEPFIEPPGYEGTGWRLAGANDLSAATLTKFRAASLALDRRLQTACKYKESKHG